MERQFFPPTIYQHHLIKYSNQQIYRKNVEGPTKPLSVYNPHLGLLPTDNYYQVYHGVLLMKSVTQRQNEFGWIVGTLK